MSLAERLQQAKTDSLAARLAEQKAAAEQARYEEWQEKEQSLPGAVRKAKELGRGVYRGLENTAIGLSDLTGDIISGVSGGRTRGGRVPEWVPRYGGQEFFPNREDVRSYVPYSSNSLTERGGELGGMMIGPGGAVGRAATAGGAALRGAVASGAYGAIHSEAEGIDRAVDAAQAAMLGGTITGGIHSATRGLGKVSPEARTLETVLDHRLGANRIGGKLPTAQRVGDDVGSRAVARVARKVAGGLRPTQAAKAKDRSQRVIDDVYQTRLMDTYGDTAAGKAALQQFRATRDVKQAMQVGDDMVRSELRAASKALKVDVGNLQAKLKNQVADMRAKHADELADARLKRSQAKEDFKYKQDWKLRRDKESGVVPKSGDGLAKARAAMRKERKQKFAAWDKQYRDMKNKRDTALRKLQEKNANLLTAAKNEVKAKNLTYDGFDPASRRLLKESIGAKKATPYGRFGPQSVAAAGDEGTAQLMKPLKKPQLGRQAKVPAEPASTTELILGGGLAAASAPLNPGLATGIGLGTARAAYRAGKAGLSRRAARRFEFIPNADDLPALKDSRVADFLAGDTALQNKIKELVATKASARVIDAAIYDAAMKAGVLPEVGDA